MKALNATEARTQLYRLLDHVSEEHSPVAIKGKRNTCVLISEQDWNSIQETLYLLSIPKMRESLVKGKKTSLSRCKERLTW